MAWRPPDTARFRLWPPPRGIIATGDEIVDVTETLCGHASDPIRTHIRSPHKSGWRGEPVLLPVAKDSQAATVALIRQGLEADLLLLSGGVSAGKYDVVEAALEECGAHFFFDRISAAAWTAARVRRGWHGKFFFGLPGNPASTMVTFELFGCAPRSNSSAGMNDSPLPLTLAKLTRPFRHKPGLTRFLPAALELRTEVTPAVDWQGSGDIPSICRARNALSDGRAGARRIRRWKT